MDQFAGTWRQNLEPREIPEFPPVAYSFSSVPCFFSQVYRLDSAAIKNARREKTVTTSPRAGAIREIERVVDAEEEEKRRCAHALQDASRGRSIASSGQGKINLLLAGGRVRLPVAGVVHHPAHLGEPPVGPLDAAVAGGAAAVAAGQSQFELVVVNEFNFCCLHNVFCFWRDTNF